MKLPIKKKYFDLIKAGVKNVEYRDAHITFVCEETGETLQKDVEDVNIINGEVWRDVLKEHYASGVLNDKHIIAFKLRSRK